MRLRSNFRRRFLFQRWLLRIWVFAVVFSVSACAWASEPNASQSVAASSARCWIDDDSPEYDPISVIAGCDVVLADTSRDLKGSELVEARFNRGIAYRNAGNLAASRTDLEFVAGETEGSSAQRMLAWTYRELGAYEEAEALISRSLNTEDHWQGYLSRCVIRQDMKKFEESEADCRRALELHQSEDAIYFLARAQQSLGKHGEAAASIEDYAGENPLSERLVDLLGEAKADAD